MIDPNSVGVEDEALRGKVMVAIHAARAAVLAGGPGGGGGHEEHLHCKVGTRKANFAIFLMSHYRDSHHIVREISSCFVLGVPLHYLGSS